MFAWGSSVLVLAVLAYLFHRSPHTRLVGSMCAGSIVGVSVGFLCGFVVGDFQIPLRHWLLTHQVASPGATDSVSRWVAGVGYFAPTIGMVIGTLIAIGFVYARRTTKST